MKNLSKINIMLLLIVLNLMYFNQFNIFENQSNNLNIIISICILIINIVGIISLFGKFSKQKSKQIELLLFSIYIVWFNIEGFRTINTFGLVPRGILMLIMIIGFDILYIMGAFYYKKEKNKEEIVKMKGEKI